MNAGYRNESIIPQACVIVKSSRSQNPNAAVTLYIPSVTQTQVLSVIIKNGYSVVSWPLNGELTRLPNDPLIQLDNGHIYGSIRWLASMRFSLYMAVSYGVVIGGIQYKPAVKTGNTWTPIDTWYIATPSLTKYDFRATHADQDRYVWRYLQNAGGFQNRRCSYPGCVCALFVSVWLWSCVCCCLLEWEVRIIGGSSPACRQISG